MTDRWRRVFLCCMTAVGLGLGAGCDMGTLAYFLMPEQRLPAGMKHLASDDDKREPRVAILSWAGLEIRTRAEFIHVDRQLSELLSQKLMALANESKEKLSFVPPRKVEEFKNDNPTWRSMGLDEVGRKLGADYVIYLEINSMSLYEPGSHNMMMRGRTNITVQLADVHKPDEAPIAETYSCAYPNYAPGGIPVDLDTQPHKFRQQFLVNVAHELARYFSKHPRSHCYRPD